MLRVQVSSNHDANPRGTQNFESVNVESLQASRRWSFHIGEATFNAYADTELHIRASHCCTSRFVAEAPSTLVGELKVKLDEDIWHRMRTYVPAYGAFEVPWTSFPLTHDARPVVGHVELLIRFMPEPSLDVRSIINEIRTHGIVLQELVGHTSSVLGCASFPDGDKVLTVSSDHKGIIWDAMSGSMIRELSGHTDWLTACAVFPSGDRVVTVSFDKTAIIWDAQSGTRLLELVGHTDWIKDCAVFPAGDRIMTASCDRTAMIWDAWTGSKITSLVGHIDWVKGCDVFPSGDKVVTVSADRTAVIWSSKRGYPGTKLLELIGHKDAVKACRVFPAGDRVVTVSRDKTGIIWDAKLGSKLVQLVGHSDWIHGCAILVGTENSTPSKFADTELHPEKTPEKSVVGNKNDTRTPTIKVLTVSSDETGIVWDAGSGQKLQDLIGHGNSLQCCAALPGRDKVVTVAGDDRGIIWDVRLAENV